MAGAIPNAIPVMMQSNEANVMTRQSSGADRANGSS
jgi:hypothetical protein